MVGGKGGLTSCDLPSWDQECRVFNIANAVSVYFKREEERWHTKTTHHIEFGMNDPIHQPCPIDLEWETYSTQGINGFPRLVAANRIAIIALPISSGDGG